MTTPPVLLQLVELCDGTPHPFAGQYVQEYDPTLRPPDDWILLRVTPDPAAAKHFPDFLTAAEYYRQVCPNRPVRDDGKPNRPLTVWTVTFARWSDTGVLSGAARQP
jgi:hypothetical protein